MGEYTRQYDFQAGQTIVADQVDAELNTIAGILNGNVDADNIKDGSVTSGKIQNGSIVQADFDTNLQQGWTASSAAWSYGSADSPSFTITESGDVTTKVYPGVRVKLNQTQGLTSYFPLEDKEATVGTYTTTNVGTATFTAGKFGNALTLNGSSQAIAINDHADFRPQGEFTIGAWFKTSNTGAAKMIFQSYSDNTNANGIRIEIAATNILYAGVGNNSATDSTGIYGTTTVTDGNWHYIVWSYRNNYSQIYLDGNLEASGYTVTPTYSATNYVRIGCRNVAGSNDEWFNGQIDDLFLINGYALDEQTIKAKYDAAEAQGTADLTLTKYFLCTKSVYSAPNTTITLYGGTDHALVNSAITSAYYSSQKAPYGFPLGEDKWTVYRDIMATTTETVVAGTWEPIGSITIIAPIGSWKLEYYLESYHANSSAEICSPSLALSESTTSVSDYRLATTAVLRTSSVSAGIVPMHKSVAITKSVKTTYNLIGTVQQGAGTITMGVYSDVTIKHGWSTMKLISTLL